MTDLKIHQRHQLKSKDIKALKEALIKQIPKENIEILISGNSKVEWIKIEKSEKKRRIREELIAIDDILCFWFRDDRYIPLLPLLLNPEITYKMKSVSVDKGAIPYIANGADVMRPGITYIDPKIMKNDIVKIQDFKYKRPLAVGLALYDADEMKLLQRGKVMKNIHTINDTIWAFSKENMFK
ncbi:MAG: PUA domain-containing protein [Promethearchaeota archaeon]